MTDVPENTTGQKPDSRHWNLLPLISTSIVIAGVLVALGAVVYLARDLMIVLFLSVLFAVFLTKLSGVIAGYTSIPYTPTVGIVVTVLLGLIFGFNYFFGSRIRSELTKAAKHIDEARTELRNKLDKYPAIEAFMDEAPVVREWKKEVTGETSAASENASVASRDSKTGKDGKAQDSSASSKAAPADPTPNSAQATNADDSASRAPLDKSEDPSRSPEESSLSKAVGGVKSIGGTIVTAVGGMIRTTFGLMLNIFIIFFMGLFIALSPEKVRDGVAKLAVPAGRDETRRVLNCLGDSLWRWLIGRLATMVMTGTSVGIGLWFLGVPMPISLGVVTGLLTFVPNIGGMLALSLAVFMALPSGLSTVLWVVGLYAAFQLVESYIFTPLIQQYQVDIPPSLLIGTQALFGFLLGFMGAMIASPGLVAFLVLHDEVYQKHILRWQKSS